MASGLSQATSTDVSLHLNAPVIVAAVLGTLLAAVAAGVLVTSRTLRKQNT